MPANPRKRREPAKARSSRRCQLGVPQKSPAMMDFENIQLSFITGNC